jgi:hypothetical protein
MWTCSCQLPLGSADVDGVVEVARGLAVDGDDGQAAEVVALGELFVVQRIDGLRAESAASASTLAGKTYGRWCLRMTISTSTPKSSGWPRISRMRPVAGFGRARGSR